MHWCIHTPIWLNTYKPKWLHTYKPIWLNTYKPIWLHTYMIAYLQTFICHYHSFTLFYLYNWTIFPRQIYACLTAPIPRFYLSLFLWSTHSFPLPFLNLSHFVTATAHLLQSLSLSFSLSLSQELISALPRAESERTKKKIYFLWNQKWRRRRNFET